MSTHLEIAKERFLDMMAGNDTRTSLEIAELAVAHATAFMIAYRKVDPEIDMLKTAAPTMKGCPKCFGSGGKRNQPCNHCNGIGKVEVQE